MMVLLLLLLGFGDGLLLRHRAELVVEDFLEGRVAVLLSDHVWLWARGYEGGGPHVALLRRLAHWLMKEPDLEEEALRLTSRGAEVVAERQTIGESVGDLVLTLPGGETRTLTPTEVAPGLGRSKIGSATEIR
mgnify:CR=1 FL=1